MVLHHSFYTSGVPILFNCAGGGGSFKGRCLPPWLESPAGHAFMNRMASITILDVPVFPFSIVFDFLRDFDEGGSLLQPRVIVGFAAAQQLVTVSSRVPAAIVVGGSTLIA